MLGLSDTTRPELLASGRREPRTGGVILANSMPIEELTDIVNSDPFAERSLAQHTLIEFHPSRWCSPEVWVASLAGTAAVGIPPAAAGSSSRRRS